MAMTHHFVSAAILLRHPNNGSLCALKPLCLVTAALRNATSHQHENGSESGRLDPSPLESEVPTLFRISVSRQTTKACASTRLRQSQTSLLSHPLPSAPAS